MIYNMITWFTDCPYFNFLASLCSMGSLLSLFIIIKRFKPKFTPVSTNSHASLIVQKLILMYDTHYSDWFNFESEKITLIPDMKNKNINLSASYEFLINNHNSLANFNIIKIKKNLLLYGCLDVLKPDYRLITTGKHTPQLVELYKLVNSSKTISNHTFSEEILRIFQ